MRWPTTAVTVALASAVALVFVGMNNRSSPAVPAIDAEIANTAPTTTEPPEQPRPSTSAAVAVIQEPSSAPLPRSFRNTDLDGSVSLDGNDRVMPTRALRDLFDYYLSGVGEYAQKDPAIAVKIRLIEYARSQSLSDPARAQLLDLFDRYMAYRKAVAEYIAAHSTEKTAQTLRILSEMRIAYLGAELAAAFYGQDEQRTRAAIARRRGHAGAASLTTRQRAALAPVDLASRVDSLRKNGADEATVAIAREQVVGRAAARRLEALDARRVQWNTTLAAYRRERAELMNSGMAAIDRQAALTGLRERYFSKHDIRRIEALDRLAAERGDLSSE